MFDSLTSLDSNKQGILWAATSIRSSPAGYAFASRERMESAAPRIHPVAHSDRE